MRWKIEGLLGFGKRSLVFSKKEHFLLVPSTFPKTANTKLGPSNAIDLSCNSQILSLTFVQQIMYKVILLLLLSLAICDDPAPVCQVQRCDQCDFSTDPVTCLTCHGWYETSGDTGFCVLSARLIIVTILGAVIFFCVLICSIIKIQEYREKSGGRPTNIESLDTPSHTSQEELSAVTWHKANQKVNDTTKCSICDHNGGTMQLKCGHVFHGDCILWQLRKNNKCPTCNDTKTESSRIYCMKCLTNFMECKPELYVDIKKKKCRVCDDCLKSQ